MPNGWPMLAKLTRNSRVMCHNYKREKNVLIVKPYKSRKESSIVSKKTWEEYLCKGQGET